MSEDYYTFIIDTTAYSGNFEREMTAFMTGVIDECEAGGEFSKMFHDEVTDDMLDIEFEDIVYQKMDDEHGIHRPCEIAITPGYINNGNGKQVAEDSEEAKTFKNKYPAYQSVAIFFSENPDSYIGLLQERAVKFADIYNTTAGIGGYLPSEKITVTGFRLMETKTTVSEQELVV